jgi:VanZ family protein
MKYHASKGRRFRLKRERPFLKVLLPLIIYAGCIYYVSSIDGNILPDINKYHMDKVAHFAEYLIFAFLAMRTISRLFPKLGAISNFIISIIVITMFGASDEIHQLLVPNRTCSFTDFVFDFLGAGMGVLIFSYREDGHDDPAVTDRSNLRRA